MLHRFDGLVDMETSAEDAEVLRFPPVVPRRHLESAGYLRSFPHLAGSVFSFSGEEAEAAEPDARASRHEDWNDLQSMTDLMLTPAACYPVYPWLASAGAI